TGDPFLLLEVLGTIAFAVSGGAVAVRAGMDWLGVMVLAVVTAVGGGTVRDLLLGIAPVSWIQDPWPIVAALVAGALVIALGHRVPHLALDSRGAVLVADAAGLAAFTVTGTYVSLAAGVSGWIAMVLGVVTGAGGGVVRDVLARQRPLILVGQIYALAALLGAAVVVGLDAAGAGEVVTRWTGVAVVLVVRLLAIRQQWTLPRFEPQDDSDR
ncbi:MAG: trimeric intracellular cation channel family protein, partial [Candidatus Nanopelagicales bacterium]